MTQNPPQQERVWELPGIGDTWRHVSPHKQRGKPRAGTRACLSSEAELESHHGARATWRHGSLPQ
jgi:hypothetical protein